VNKLLATLPQYKLQNPKICIKTAIYIVRNKTMIRWEVFSAFHDKVLSKKEETRESYLKR